MEFVSINELMEVWKKRHQNEGKKHFVYDGIVDENNYKKMPLRVCYVLKECYLTQTDKQNDIKDSDKYHQNPDAFTGTHYWIKHIYPDKNDHFYRLTENILVEDNWYMWHRIEHLTSNFWYSFTDERITGYDKNNKYNNKIAVIDIKKSDGESSSKDKDILKYATDDRDYLLEEFRLVNANVIFFGGTFDICLKANLIDSEKIKNAKKISFEKGTGFRTAYYFDNKILIDGLHPAARGISYKMNDSVIPTLKELLKEFK